MKRSRSILAGINPLALIPPLLVAACSSAAPPPPDSGAGSDPPNKTKTAPATSRPAGAAGAPSGARESPFHVIAQTRYPLSFKSPPGGLLVHGGPILTEIKDDRLVRDDSYTKGLPIFGGVADIIGKWPDSARMTYISSNGRIGWGELYDWKGSGWKQVGFKLPDTWVYAGVSPWSQDRHLALLYRGMPFPPGPAIKFKVLSGAPAGPLPELTRATGNKDRECYTAVDPAGAFLARPEGHVFLFGMSCPDEQAIFEWWSPGSQASQIHKVPLDIIRGLNSAHFTARSPSDVYLSTGSPRGGQIEAERPVLFHFNGTTWKEVEAPPTHHASLVATEVTKDGTLWGVTLTPWIYTDWTPEKLAGQVWKRPPGGAWELVPLPSTYPFPVDPKMPQRGATSIHVDENDDVWVAADGAVLRTSPPKQAPELVDWEYNQQFAATFRVPRAATSDCESIFALFYAFTKVTPDDYDFPLTRKALKGQTQFSKARFVVTRENGQKYFGAFVPDLALGKRMVERIRKEVEGSSPQLLCAKPEVVRELPLDLRTGEVDR
jgi:hypothetical protein